MIQKLIDAYELEREMYRKCINTDEEIEKGRAKWDSGLWIRYKVFEDAITLAPRVEAEPVRHGKWIYKEHIVTPDMSIGYFICSECGCVSGNAIGNHYCFHCGAKMDLEEVKDNETN